MITKAGLIQVGSGSVELVDSSSQVTPDPVVSTEDKSSEVTEDLVDTSHKHSQTQFLVPGHENNPEYDPYWLNTETKNMDSYVFKHNYLTLFFV